MVVETHNNKLKKLPFTEEDAYSLLQRYPAAVILSVLREVAQYPSVKINWENLLKKTNSGIKSAAELQLLWRHLAYRHPLSIPPSPSSYPSDDDSDLEFELEPFPPVSTELTSDAANCVKVLAFGSTSESGVSTAEAELPNGSASRLFGSDSAAVAPSSGQSEGIDVSASVNANANNIKKKRKWTDEEESQLLAGVRKWGEGNWAAILKEYPWARTPSQLSQRWANMRRKQGSVNVGACISTGQHLSEAQLATRRAIDLALKDNLTAAVGNNNAGKPKVSNGESPGSINTGAAQRQISQAPTTPASTSAKAGVVKPRAAVKKAAPKPATVSDSIQRTAVAAGARIVNPSDADALRNFANVHFFRTSTPVSVGQPFPSGGPPAKDTVVKASLPAAAGSQLPKPRSLPAVCSSASASASANDRIQKKEEKTPIEINETTQMVRLLPKAKSRLTTVGDLTKQTAVMVDVSENVSTTQVSGIPVVDGKLESFKSSVADGSTEKMEVSSEGLVGAK